VGDTHSIIISLELFNFVHENDFINKNFENPFGPIIIFSPTTTISLSLIFKFEILIFEQQMKMDINNFEFIYFPIMDEFHQMIYLFNQNH